MAKKFVAGKLLLASSIGLTAIGGSLSYSAKPAEASESSKEVNYEQIGKEFVQSARNNDWDGAHRLLNFQMQEAAKKEYLAALWEQSLQVYGKVNKISFKEVRNDPVHKRVVFLCEAENGQAEIVIKVTKTGFVDEFFIDNLYPEGTFKAPIYDKKNYTERQIKIGEDEFALPGKLTIPEGKGPFPVVVLVHGSGPHDEDATFGFYKPFRDIAVGLANEGIAVLRYEKRTKTHTIKSALNPAFTIREETAIDANLAVASLLNQPDIDTGQMFVFGHSQGAYALPLIVDNDKQKRIKGIIGAAGPAGSFADLLLSQFDKQLELAVKRQAPAEQVALIKESQAFFEEQFSILNDPQYSAANVPENFMLQPSWWFNIRDYKPVDLAKKQNVPFLVLQGGKDLQVPVSEFEQWKKELKDRPNVQYKLYPHMFHTLGNYAGEPDYNKEYTAPGFASKEMINDLALWIKEGKVTEAPKVDPLLYSDYAENLYWSEAFLWALNKGYVVGFADEKRIKPDLPITEGQYLKVIFRYMLGAPLPDESSKAMYGLARKYQLPVKNKAQGVLTRGQAALLLTKTFTGKNMTERKAVEWLYEQDAIQGYKEEISYDAFQPHTNITRAHLVTILYNLHEKGWKPAL